MTWLFFTSLTSDPTVAYLSLCHNNTGLVALHWAGLEWNPRYALALAVSSSRSTLNPHIYMADSLIFFKSLLKCQLYNERKLRNTLFWNKQGEANSKIDIKVRINYYSCREFLIGANGDRFSDDVDAEMSQFGSRLRT